MRVLVVEDNEVLAASMCDGLGARGPGADVAGTLAGADSAFYLWGEEIGGRVIRELLHNAIAHQGCPALRPRAHAQDGAARGGGERRCRRRPRQARRQRAACARPAPSSTPRTGSMRPSSTSSPPGGRVSGTARGGWNPMRIREAKLRSAQQRNRID